MAWTLASSFHWTRTWSASVPWRRTVARKMDIVVPDVDRVISRFHCEISKKNGLMYVTDLRSSNGTRLEGVPLQPGQPALLRKGNRLLLADSVELRFGYARRSKTEELTHPQASAHTHSNTHSRFGGQYGYPDQSRGSKRRWARTAHQ